MGTENDLALRELRAAQRALSYGLTVLRVMERPQLTYLLQTRSPLSLDQVDELLSMLEGTPASTPTLIPMTDLAALRRAGVEYPATIDA